MPKLLWLDLETTGLKAGTQQILEVALSIADMSDPFNTSPVFHSVVFFPRELWETLDPYILEMHTKNGLLDDCAKAKAPLINVVEAQLLKHVLEEKERDNRPILAGSSIHFDHDFIDVHMPTLASRLSYRHYDVSSLKLYCQSMGMSKFRKAEAHRACPDIEESIKHAQECTEWLKKHLV